MKLINTLWDSNYSKLGISHSVLLHDDLVLSYIMEEPLGKWKFSIITKKEWLTTFNEIVSEKTVPYIDFMKYKGLKMNGITCFEAIEYVYSLEWIKMKTGRLKTVFTLFFILFVFRFVFFILWILFWIQLSDEQVVAINEFTNNYRIYE